MEGNKTIYASVKAHEVCNACKLIDFNVAFALPLDPTGDSPWRHSGISLAKFAGGQLLGARDCSLCQLIIDKRFCSNLAGKSSVDENWELRAFSLYHLSNPFPGPSSDITRWQGTAEPSLVLVPEGLIVTPQDDELRQLIVRKGHLACLKTPDLGKPGKPRLVPKSFDAQAGTHWINMCQERHGQNCNRRLPLSGFRLVDCDSLAIVHAQDSMSWTALSYVWANAQDVYSGHTACSYMVPHQQRLPNKLPGVVLDAISVTKQLGYKYIWIDRYCIYQNDLKDVEDQINKMDRIYQGSEITIVAAARQNGLPGVGKTKRRHQHGVRLENGVTVLTTPPHISREKALSPWSFRGWTYQEGVLSRRRLLFTEDEVLFECNEPISWWESMSELALDPKPKNHTENPKVPFYDGSRWYSSCLEWTLSKFYMHISNFSQRQLSHDSDTLRAITGITNTFNKNSPLSELHQPYMYPTGLHPICGIASITQKTAGFTDTDKQVLALGLCWFHCSIKSQEPRRNAEFPSWSWAGWKGQVGWPLTSEAGLDEFVMQSEVLEFVPRPSEKTSHPTNTLRLDLTGIKVTAKCLSKELFEFPFYCWAAGCLAICKHSFRFQGEEPWDLAPQQFITDLEAGRMICILVGDQGYNSVWPRKGVAQYFDLHILVLATVPTVFDEVVATERVGLLRFRYDCSTVEGKGTTFDISSLLEMANLPRKKLLIF